jgi:hypothetical protein
VVVAYDDDDANICMATFFSVFCGIKKAKPDKITGSKRSIIRSYGAMLCGSINTFIDIIKLTIDIIRLIIN